MTDEAENLEDVVSNQIVEGKPHRNNLKVISERDNVQQPQTKRGLESKTTRKLSDYICYKINVWKFILLKSFGLLKVIRHMPGNEAFTRQNIISTNLTPMTCVLQHKLYINNVCAATQTLHQ